MSLHLGDCLEVLRTLPSDSVDALVTDPPAGIRFMNRVWDTDHGGRLGWITAMTVHFRECFQVMKPGAHGLVWAIPRTSHWTATALEDAGFEVRDFVCHHFGSGFPKSRDVSKAIDEMAGVEREVVGSKYGQPGYSLVPNKGHLYGGGFGGSETSDPQREAAITAPATEAAQQWSGWGTALKPATEVWWLIRKPLAAPNVAANVLQYNCGAINIDACRVGLEARGPEASGRESDQSGDSGDHLRGLRERTPPLEVRSGSGETSDDLQSRMSLPASAGTGERELARRVLCGEEDRLPIVNGTSPTSRGSGVYPGAEAQRDSRAPISSSPDARAPAFGGGGRSSPEREQVGQPSRESTRDELGRSRSGAPEDRAGTPSASSTESSSIGSSPLHRQAPLGRWPSNAVFSHFEGCREVGVRKVRGGNDPRRRDGTVNHGGQVYGGGLNGVIEISDQAGYADSDGTETVTAWECAEGGCPVAELDRQSGTLTSGSRDAGDYGRLGYQGWDRGPMPAVAGDSGGASRFFYTAKASTAERNQGLWNPSDRNLHPTVKPVDLMRWLCRLITPPGGTILDPFMGSGSTGVAARLEGFEFIGIEKDPESFETARKRLGWAVHQPGLFD